MIEELLYNQSAENYKTIEKENLAVCSLYKYLVLCLDG